MSKVMEEFAELGQKKHTEQGIWWLNGFWKEGASEYAEEIWNQVHMMIELEAGRPKIYGSKVWEIEEGCDVDEFKAHNFMEKLGETMTVQALRKKLKELDIDNNKRMSLIEYLTGKYGRTAADVVNSPQGGQAEASKLEAAKKSVEAASAALSAAVAEEEASKAAAASAADALAESEKAAAELAAAVAELEAQEKAIADKKAAFQKKIDDEALSAMKRNMAKNELAQMEAEDPMPLRKAKITQKAALKKADKAKKLAAEEKEKADAAEAAAVQSKADAEKAFQAAEEELDILKKKGDGVAQGAVWWMERELAERRKFMPRGKK